MILRNYQEIAIQSVFDYFNEGNTGNPLIVAPTGVGKSVIIAGLLQRIFAQWPSQRVMMLVHVKELIEQNYDKLKTIWPQAPCGIYSAGVGKRESHYPITFAGIQSVCKKAHLFKHIDLVFVDEAHRISTKAGSSYMKFFYDLYKVNPHIKIVGLTATDYRMGVGHIWGKENSIFHKRCINLADYESFNWFINEGYLVPLFPLKTKHELDVSDVPLVGGEYNLNQLQLAVNKEDVTRAAIEQCIEHCSDRDSWLVFCSGVDHAINVSDMLNEYGISSQALHSNISKAEREEILRAFKNKEFKALTNNNILTTGFDDPNIELIVSLRPTLSPGLWVQMCGRGTRPLYAAGFDLTTTEGRLEAIRQSRKRDCLVMDFSGNTSKLGPINDPVVPREKGKRKGEAPVKVCPHCGTYNHAKVTHCIKCGQEFSFEVKIKKQASEEELLKTDFPVIEVFEVVNIAIQINKGREGKPDSLKITYYTTKGFFSEFLCFNHPDSSFPRRRAVLIWRERSDLPVPSNVEEALKMAESMAPATHVRVHTNIKYPEIKALCYDGTAFGTIAPNERKISVDIENENGVIEIPPDFDDDIPF